MYGSDLGTVRIKTWTETFGVETTLYSRSGHSGDFWERVDIKFDSDKPFQVILEGMAGDGPLGDIAVDDTSFTPDCKRLTDDFPSVPYKPTISPCGEGKWQCTTSNDCINTTQICDWVSDCPSGDDEQNCGPCDFEDYKICGYTDVSTGEFAWHRHRPTSSETPSQDHTSGSGYTLKADLGFGLFNSPAIVESPLLQPCSVLCTMKFWFVYSSQSLGKMVIRVLDAADPNDNADLWWLPKNESITTWTEAVITIGRRKTAFKLQIEASVTLDDEVSIDDITFENCDLDQDWPCEVQCGNDVCVPEARMCDYSDDCGNSFDEDNCDNFVERCDFENGMCNYNQSSTDDTDWMLDQGTQVGFYDHTTNTLFGSFLYLADKTEGNRADLNSVIFKMPPLDGSCVVRFWYRMYGIGVNKLEVSTRYSIIDAPESLLKLEGSKIDGWQRAEQKITIGARFQLVIEAVTSSAIPPGENIAIDDISFTKACQVDTDQTLPNHIKPTSHPDCGTSQFRCSDGSCIDQALYCDFKPDCPDSSDERLCPSWCTFEDKTLCEWRQVGDFKLSMRSGKTPDDFKGPANDFTGDPDTAPGVYLYTTGSASQNTHKAQLASPTFHTPSTGCTFSLYYHLFGDKFGDLTISYRMEDGTTLLLAKMSDDIGPYNKWDNLEAMVPSCLNAFQILVEVQDQTASANAGIALDELRFINCAYQIPKTCPGMKQCKSGHCYPETAECDFQKDCCDFTDEAAVTCGDYKRCNFDKGLCDWTQATGTTAFAWRISRGKIPNSNTGPTGDHTGSGSYLYAASVPENYGKTANLVSNKYTIAAGDTCKIRFFYFMFGTGIRDLKVLKREYKDSNYKAEVVWSMTGSQENRWLRAEAQVPNGNRVFQIGLQATIGNSPDGNIAVDDVSFTPACKVSGDGLLQPPTTSAPPVSGVTPVTCGKDKFKCSADNKCIPLSAVCDSREQCSDGEDEQNCWNGTSTVPPKETPSPRNDQSNVAIIIISVIGSVFILVLLVIIAFLYSKRVQQTKRFGGLTTEMGLENPAYGADGFGETALTDFTASGYDPGMFAGEGVSP
ncbi:MAM and LDL-receptor class A domain-containing protein 1-like isoform X2 [Acanthaster planci]|uniref:MAM and LDL-receptor class A domain-containing protein 1-like isoform X2 n=1 Tax=Acanthaster planci TaxID=133434 RepID=A0A8B7YZ75_ACAPL|nr:MAM and LDL-receptor class A domain-containing protein 1-like isoform X2 [Acanthaster planci]